MLSDTARGFFLRYGRVPTKEEYRLLMVGPQEELNKLIEKLESERKENTE